MSFKGINGKRVTLENYKDLYKEYPVDILDEIRSAVLDDTPIHDFIEPCVNDSYKLGQVRMALREGVPIAFLRTYLTSITLYNIRQAAKRDIDMSDLLVYYERLEPSTIEILSEAILSGVDISRIDFRDVPMNLVSHFTTGLKKGYPMWLLVQPGVRMTDSKITLLMRGLSLKVDVSQLLSDDWEDDVLVLLFSYAKTVDINAVLRYITPKFSVDVIRELLDLLSEGVDIRRLVVRDADGYPIYNSCQIYALGKAIKEGTVIDSMFNPNLSDWDMTQLALWKKNRLASSEES